MGDFLDSVLEGLFDVIRNVMELVLDSFVGRLMYYAETGLCKIVGMLDQMFQIFAGITKVSYDGRDDYLVNVFFTNRSINNVYWAMALIGIAMAFCFAIAAVIRKLFDASGKVQQSLGETITSLVRTIFLILSMSAIMIIILNSTNVLMKQINLIFNDSGNLDLPETIVYTDEQYAMMGRVLNTIGNYSLNSAYSSRYNINACFNDIRVDLGRLQDQKVFRYYYNTPDKDGKIVTSWQSVLQKVANSHDLRTDLKMDVSYDAVTNSLLEAMEIIRSDASFRPLESYTRIAPPSTSVPLDRYLFLMGTMHAAKNNAYNENPEITDSVRGPYYLGEKNIYSIKQVSNDFDVGFATDYLIVFFTGVVLIFDLVTIILNCIARIFNMLFLYIIAPPIFATRPLDGGGKTKQWTTAFIVQAFSVFGTVIAMRLLLIMLPIVTSSKLVLFKDNSTMNIMAKLVFIYGLFEVTKKATGLLTGILADSAGWQSVQAGDMSGSAGKMIGAAKAIGGTALKATGAVANFATKPVQNLAGRAWGATGGGLASKWSNLGKGDVAGQKAMAAAQERLAAETAYEKLRGGGYGEGGKKPAQPPASGGQKAPRAVTRDGITSYSGGSVPAPPKAANAPKAVPPAPASFHSNAARPQSAEQELAQKAGTHLRPQTNAQGDMINKGMGIPNAPAQGPAPVPQPPQGNQGPAHLPQQGNQGPAHLPRQGNQAGGAGDQSDGQKKPVTMEQQIAAAAAKRQSVVSEDALRPDVTNRNNNTVDAASGSRPVLNNPPEAAPAPKEAPPLRPRMSIGSPDDDKALPKNGRSALGGENLDNFFKE